MRAGATSLQFLEVSRAECVSEVLIVNRRRGAYVEQQPHRVLRGEGWRPEETCLLPFHHLQIPHSTPTHIPLKLSTEYLSTIICTDDCGQILSCSPQNGKWLRLVHHTWTSQGKCEVVLVLYRNSMFEQVNAESCEYFFYLTLLGPDPLRGF